MNKKVEACNHLLLLIGSNPLPNYLAALILNPKSAGLFYTPETKTVKNRLAERLNAALPGLSLDAKCIKDATNAAKVRNAFDSTTSDAFLHYTGGTKIMAAHACMAFRNAGGKDERASYLDERRGILRFDDGDEIDLSNHNLVLRMDDILMLHGIDQIDKGDPSQMIFSEDDAKSIAHAILEDPGLADKLYKIHCEEKKRRSFGKAKQSPVMLSNLIGERLSILQFPEKGWTKKMYEKGCNYLGGGWLEKWCHGLVRDIARGDEISVGINCKLASNRQFEIDLALVRGHRVYVISCTTDTKIGLCKSKLFEVAMRARQLGGDLARSALVCLLNGNDRNGAFVDQLRNDVADIWDAPNTPQVFGLDDLKEWAGAGGRQNVATLQQWLDS